MDKADYLAAEAEGAGGLQRALDRHCHTGDDEANVPQEWDYVSADVLSKRRGVWGVRGGLGGWARLARVLNLW